MDCLAPPCNARLLAVTTCEENRRHLEHLTAGSCWKLDIAGGIAEAARLLRHLHYPVLVCDQELPDGRWPDLLAALKGQDAPPKVLVLGDVADQRMWGQVLSLGGYDLLSRRPRREDLFPVLSMAWSSWKTSAQPKRAEPVAAPSRLVACA